MDKSHKERIITALRAESRLTYKVQVLFKEKLKRETAWVLLKEIEPHFKKSTFNCSWTACKRSAGRTPLQMHV